MARIRNFAITLCILALSPVPEGGSKARAQAQAQTQAPPLRVAIIADGPWERNEGIRQRFRDEIVALMDGEFDVRFPRDFDVEADWTMSGIEAALSRALQSDAVDVVLALGVMVGDAAARRQSLEKPVIAPFVIDAELQAFPRANGASGKPNFNYLSRTITFRRELGVFLEIASFERLSILTTESFLENVPGLRERMESIVSDFGIELEMTFVGSSADEALVSMPEDVHAVFLYPLLRLGPGEFDKLVEGLKARHLPSFASFFTQTDVRRGLLAGLSEEPIDRRARRVALNLQRVVLGEDAGEIPVDYAEREELVVNMATARAINVYPSFAIMTVAELVGQERDDVERQLDLKGAVREALASNLDLRSLERSVLAGEQDVRIARSNLLPQVEVTGPIVTIDQDRADASFGAQGRTTFSPTARVTQLLYAESARAGASIEEYLQDARLADLGRAELDVAAEAASAYLNVLRAKTVERIQQNNLGLSRSNLELARSRETIGVSGPSEVLRWESAIASDRAAVIEAAAQRNVAEIALNRLLHRPLEEPFLTTEIGLEDDSISVIQRQIRRFMVNPWYFDIFRDFVVTEGLRIAPELSALDRAIDARARSLLASRRSFFVPDVFVAGEVTRLFKSSANGSPTIPTDGLGFAFPQTDYVNWSVAVQATLPLFTGGFRRARRSQDSEILSQLRFERQATAERIELRIRAGLHGSGASLAGIALSRAAAEAARENLELVTDAYSRGVVSILQLLDAQNAALVAEEAAANAVYDFLLDFIDVERASGRFYFLATEQERTQLLERAEQFYEERGAQLPRNP